MSQQVEKLKKKAAEFEAKRQPDKALATYLEILRIWDAGDDDDVDVPLYNRVGDMLIRAGNIGDAMSVLEKAVDYYGESGFPNNAIALCNKILRHSPGRTSVYYKLGKMSAQKGFKGEAKKNYLEYADRMQKANNIDEAFRALKEFADLCPDDNDIRQTLADQLAKLGRQDEAMEQLQLLYERYESTGDSEAAVATFDRMRRIDPAVEPKRSGPASRRKTAGLVFIDVDSPAQAAPGKGIQVPTPSKAAEAHARRTRKSAIEGLPLIDTGETAVEPVPAERSKSTVARAAAVEPAAVEPLALEPLVEEPLVVEPPAVEHVELEPLVDEPLVIEPTPIASLLVEPPVIEPTPLESLVVEPPAVEPTELEPLVLEPTPVDSLVVEPLATEPLIDEARGVELAAGELIDAESLGVEPLADELTLTDTAAADTAAGDVAAGESSTAADPFGHGASYGATFGTADADAAESVPELETTAFGGESGGEGGVVSALSSPEDATFGTLGDEVLDPGLSVEPESLEFRPDADLGALDLPLELDAGELSEPTPEAPRAVPAKPDSKRPDAAVAKPVEEPPRKSVRRTVRPTMSVLAQSVDLLRDTITKDATNWQLHREFGEALLEDGDREGGLEQIETAMVGFERDGDLESARSVAEEIIRLNPLSVRHHQKRVEYAFRTDDRPRLVEAYVDLADALFRAGQAEKSKVVYQRVLELAPDDARALAALTAFAEAHAVAPEPMPSVESPPPPLRQPRRSAAVPAVESSQVAPPAASPRAPRPTPTAVPAAATRGAKSEPAGDFVDLEDWLKEDEGPKSTRMIVEDEKPTGDERADFDDMLRKFKQGVAENVEDEDHESHYDLGIAYKEMGLVEEAIAEFQKALRGQQHRVRTYEALGQCFVEKGQEAVAMTILQRALAEPGTSDDRLIGVLYLLGTSSEVLNQPAEAVKYYRRVFAVDINFRDVQQRMRTLEQAGK